LSLSTPLSPSARKAALSSAGEGATAASDVAATVQFATDVRMASNEASARALIDALEDPTLIVRGHIVAFANAAARRLLGAGVEGRDVRLAIRHPQALDQILAARSADVEVTIQNASPVVEHYSTTVVGLPSKELSSCEPDVVQLRPKEVGNVRLQVSVPEKGGLVAGPYTLGVLVRSPYQREVSRCEELNLDVQPAPSLTMTVQPEVATGGKVGHYMVSLANEGNTPLAVTLSGGDPENLVGFDIRPRELRLEPGMAASAQITASAMPPLTGQDVRRSLTLRAHAGDVMVERPVALVQKPRIKGGWMKIGALTAGLAVLTGATLGGAALIRSVKQPAQPVPINQRECVGAYAELDGPARSQSGT